MRKEVDMRNKVDMGKEVDMVHNSAAFRLAGDDYINNILRESVPESNLNQYDMFPRCLMTSFQDRLHPHLLHNLHLYMTKSRNSLSP